MGLPMASRLVDAGFDVCGFDLSQDARNTFAHARGGRSARTAAAAVARAEVVVLMLPSSSIIEQAVIRSGLHDDLHAVGGPAPLLLDMGSSDPGSTRQLATVAAERGIGVVDAPVSGGVRGAVDGTLTIMVGGAEEDVARVEPLLEALGNAVRVGALGAGHALKSLNNLLSATHLLASAEVLRIGRAFGLDPTMLAAINASSGRSGSTELKLPQHVLPGTFMSGFRLDLLAKDVGVAVTLAEEMGVRSRLADAVLDLWRDAGEALEDGADHTEIYRWVAAGEPDRRGSASRAAASSKAISTMRSS
jgi:3-hydroxyisobutyrate dehydrogenase